MQEDRFDRFYSTLGCALKSIQKLKTKYMLPYGLSSAHTMCLRHLYASPEGLTRTKIVRLCDIDKAQVSRVINELCAKGYVIETENENINYRKRLKLSPLGREIAEQVNKLIADINAYVSADIEPEEIEIFYRVFEKLCERLKESEDMFSENKEGQT